MGHFIWLQIKIMLFFSLYHPIYTNTISFLYKITLQLHCIRLDSTFPAFFSILLSMSTFIHYYNVIYTTNCYICSFNLYIQVNMGIKGLNKTASTNNSVYNIQGFQIFSTLCGSNTKVEGSNITFWTYLIQCSCSLQAIGWFLWQNDLKYYCLQDNLTLNYIGNLWNGLKILGPSKNTGLIQVDCPPK